MGTGRHGRKSPSRGCVLVLTPGTFSRLCQVGMGRTEEGVGCCGCRFLLMEGCPVCYTRDMLQSLLTVCDVPTVGFCMLLGTLQLHYLLSYVYGLPE